VYGAVDDAPVAETRVCRPLSCYGVGKYASEGYLRVYQSKLPLVILRMFNVYGPGQDMRNLRQGMVSIFLAQALATGKIEVKGSVDRFRDMIYIDDVVEAWYRAATRVQAMGRTFNVATGVKTTVGSLLEKICAIVPGASFYVQGTTPGDQSGVFADVSGLGDALDLRSFTSLDVGLLKFVEWAKYADFQSS
jgi:UDP-glucose 4-epimerase